MKQLAHTDTDPGSKLVALRRRLKRSNEALTIAAEKQFHQLAKGPTNQNIETWLDDWTDMFHEATRLGVAEVAGNRAFRDFFLAIRAVDPVYADTRRYGRENMEDLAKADGILLNLCSMDEEVERYRNSYRLKQASSATKHSRSSFATDATTPTFKAKTGRVKPKRSKKIPTCICGDKMWFADCPYIVPSKAHRGWKEDPAIRNKVNEALQDSKIEERVKRSLENRAKFISQTPSCSSFKPTKPSRKTLTANPAIATDKTGIKNYLINASGAHVHVCNADSAHLYIKLRDSKDDEFLNTGNGKVKIEHWGIMETAFENPDGGLHPIILENVAFVGSFCTSLVSQSVLDGKAVHLDTEGPHLLRNGKVEFLLHRNGGLYTFTASGVPHSHPHKFRD